MQLSRSQIMMSGLLVLVIAGAAMSAIALGRSAARGARPAITYTSETRAEWRVTDADGANGREAPGFAGEIVHRFAFNEIVETTGRVADVQDEAWREVGTPGGEDVWVRTALLGRVDDGSTTPPTTTAPPETTPPTTTPTVVPSRPAFETEDPGLWDVTGIAEGASLNVRSGPGTNNSVIARLAHDTGEIRSTGSIARVDGSLWRQVEYRSGSTGWAKASFLEPHETSPPPPVFGKESPGGWDVTGLSTRGSLNVRQGPGTTTDVVARLAPDAVDLRSTGRTATVSGSLWREVKYDSAGRTGWVSTRYLTAHVPVTPDPVTTPDPAAPPRGIVLMGDWNGNGVSTPGIFHNGDWYLRFSNAEGKADLVFAFGKAGDHPIAGDWNGDGIDTIGVFRDGTWSLRNSNSAGAADLSFAFGEPGDIPIAGDWNGDGIDTAGVARKATWHLRNSNSSGSADVTFEYGDSSDKPIVGDWNGDGADTAGAVRGDRWLLRNVNAAGSADVDFRFGESADISVAGDWNGDGKDTPGVVRGFTWHFRNQASGGAAEVAFRF